MVNFDGINISHFIPGRVRLRVQQLKKNEDLANQIRNYASGMDLIEKLEINTLTGSVLIEYNPEQKEEIKQLLYQAKRFNLIPEDLEMDKIHAILEGKEDPSNFSGDFSEDTRFFFKQLNNKVRSWTGDAAGLNELIPIGLFGMGIRSLLVAETLAGPPWHTYFWYAFSTFLILNPAGQPETRKKSRRNTISG